MEPVLATTIPTLPESGWFSEVSPEQCPGQCFSLEVDAVLHHQKSTYQDILVFQSKTYGRVLVLDGMIQVTERDEFAYQEMLAHLPMFSHPNPQQVLIVGGGDGGILREVLKHPAVVCVVQCEIDGDVVEVSKKWFPTLAESFTHPKLTLHIGDGFEFLKSHPGQFDVIITDSSDPIGPAESLFGEAYYELLSKALQPNGVIALQGESAWLHLDLIKSMLSSCRKFFPVVKYAYSSVPSYPSGQIGYILGSTNKETTFEVPARTIKPLELDQWKLRYYDDAIHKASFVLPRFVSKAFFP